MTGYNRIVIILPKIVIKLPNILNGSRAFVHGLMHNLKESELYYESYGDPQLGRVYFCSPFGLMLVMKRYTNVLTETLSEADLQNLPISNPDRKIGNYAQDEQGRIIVLDYGHCNCYYIGSYDEQNNEQNSE